MQRLTFRKSTLREVSQFSVLVTILWFKLARLLIPVECILNVVLLRQLLYFFELFRDLTLADYLEMNYVVEMLHP